MEGPNALACVADALRDGPLEKLWGGGEGNFRAAGIFFVIKFLA